MFSDLRREVPLLTPGIAILSVGTEIYYGDTMTQDLGWVDELNKGWSRPAVEEVAKEMNLKYQVQLFTHFFAPLQGVSAEVEVLYLGQVLI